MNFNQLRYFLEVAKTGSFTQASENLFISQPSLSVSIQKLEGSLGVKLFNRDKNRNKKVLLTNSGKYLLSQAETILSELELVEIKLRQSHNDKKILRIGILDSLPIACIAKLISNFSKIHPDIMIEQLSGSKMKLKEWLEKKYIDLAINIADKQKDGDISQILFSQNYQITFSVNHHLAKKESLYFSDLDGLPYIERIHSEISSDLQSLFTTKKVLPNVVYRTSHDELSNNLVLLGKGVTVMPVQENILGILQLPFSDINLTRQVSLVSQSNNNSKYVDLFHEFSSDYFKQNT